MIWEKVKIGDVFDLVRNGASIKQDSSKKGVPITRIETIANGVIDTTKLGYADILDDDYKEYYLKEGDILMSHINSWAHLGKTALVEEIDTNIIHGMNLLLLRSNKSSFPKYLKYFFETTFFKKQLLKISNQSVNQSSFATTKLKEIQILLPPLPTQKKIAAILDEADALRKKDQQLLEQYDVLLQSIFYDMFGDPVKNEKGWDTKPLIDCVEIKGGGTPSTSKEEYYNGDIPWISPKDMKTSFVNDSIDKITEIAIQESSTKIIEVNSVLVVVRSGILKNTLPIAINTVPVAINQDMKAFTCFSFLTPIFLMFQLKSLESKILQSVRGTTADNISSEVLKKLILIIPPLVKQIHFASIAQNIQLQKQQIKQQLLQSEALFQSLLQKAFNGELIK